MRTSSPIIARFVRFLERSEDPGDLFTEEVLSDFNVPHWRYQLVGVEDLARAIRHDSPNRVTVGRVESCASGFLLEAEIDVWIDGEPYY